MSRFTTTFVIGLMAGLYTTPTTALATDPNISDDVSPFPLTKHCYRDLDGDGYGGHESPWTIWFFQACSGVGATWTEENGDCRDSDASVNPAASETYYNGIDDNCDGTGDGDADGDGCPASFSWLRDNGYSAYSYDLADYPDCPGSDHDCNDSNAAIFPGAADDNCDAVDDNCSGDADEEAPTEEFTQWCYDEDGDSFGRATYCLEVCVDDPNDYDLTDVERGQHGGTTCTGDCYDLVDNNDDCNDNDAEYYDDNPDPEYVYCLDPDDDGILTSKDEEPLHFEEGSGQTLDGSGMEDSLEHYRGLVVALQDEYEVEGTDGEWIIHSGDYGTFYTASNETAVVSAELPEFNLILDASMSVRITSGTAFWIAFGDHSENVSMDLLVITTDAVATYTYNKDTEVLTLRNETDTTSGYDFDGDGYEDAGLTEGEWYELNIVNGQGTDADLLIGEEKVHDHSCGNYGDRVSFGTLDAEVDVHALNWKE